MKVVYFSQTGNTEKMAELILEGIELEGKKAELVEVSSVSLDDAKNEEILILGCSAYGSEELDENEMEPFVKSLEGNIQGKKVALFGSWGWGNGEWMTEWEKRMKSYRAILISEGLTVQESPEGEDEDRCRDFGKLIAKL
ncbi:flavodoxin [Clostridium saccharobutylicum]|uniref:Flavodoxin n=1 Tax=Clostridium saccharobutylicum DSM 13864 TaxID=1345695 RepID=U5MW32_CLOSA|nr:flavodoxin [Clostridium saccharobutylicum]AGX44753.1 flavodoxin [Clostridium saccharobutylicum DSM 13864]AQR92040.1 flavodoxin [Clostridium saccharobutylicum]AQS01942.1 flavodoxin [Clostridium saccharobutylicum]AQS15925.1 flavodoxin [Clostridium saccharobutylicum]MBA2903535.1 flavodoxin short chain [Clostridium saccharobutylicum]